MSELSRFVPMAVSVGIIRWEPFSEGVDDDLTIVGYQDSDIAALRATITQQAQELAESERKLRGVCMAHGPALLEIHDLKKELAASQARCRELEDHVGHYKSVSTGQYLKLTEAKTEIAQLQATLAAREARIEHLEGVLKFVGVSEDADSIIMDMKKYHASHRCENHMADPWRGIDTEIDCFVCLKQQRDAAVQDAARLREALEAALPIAVEWCNPEEAKEMAAIKQAQEALKGT